MSTDRFPTDECRQLLGEIDATCSRAQKIAFYAAIAKALAAVLAILFVAAAGHALLKTNSAAVRYLVSAAVIAGVVCIALRLWTYSRGLRISRTELAARVRTPNSSDASLRTIVELAEIAEADDPRFGSKELRGNVLRQWFASQASPQWDRMIDATTLRISVFLLILTLATTLCAIAISPGGFGVGLWRVTAPVSNSPWPQQTRLSFINLPEAMPVGESLLVQIEDLVPPLPREVTVEYRQEGEADSSVFIAAPIGEADTNTVQVRLPAARRAFSIRATGGDDQSMPWQDVDVVTAPELVNASAAIEPPSYSRLPSQSLDGRRFRALAGSQVTIRGTLSQPFEAIELRDSQYLGEAAGQSVDQWELSLAKNRRDFVIRQSSKRSSAGSDRGSPLAGSDTVALNNSVRFHLDVVSARANVVLENAVEIACYPDLPPQIEPTESDRFVGIAGRIRVQSLVRDDLGLNSVSLLLRESTPQESPAAEAAENRDADDETRDESAAERELRRWDTPGVDENTLAGSFATADSPEESLLTRAVNETVDVKELQVSAGAEFTLLLRAVDSLGQSTDRIVGDIKIATPDEIAAELSQRRSRVLKQAERIVASQKAAASVAKRIESLLEQGGSDEAAGALAQELAREQTDIAGMLKASTGLERGDSIRAELDSLLRSAEDSGTPIDGLRNQIQQAITQLEESALPAIDASAQAAEQIAGNLQADASADQAVQQLLDSQGAASDALQGFRDTLARGEMLALFRDELSRTLMRQQALSSSAEAVQFALLQRKPTPEDDATISQLAKEQAELADQLSKIVDRMRQTTATTAGVTDETDERTVIAKAQGILDSGPTATSMQRSSSALNRKQFAEARNEQAQVVQDLSKAIEDLGGELSRQVDQNARLSKQADTLANLAQRQRALVDEISKAGMPSNAGVRGIIANGVASDQIELLADTRQVIQHLTAEQAEVQSLMQDAVVHQESAAKNAVDAATNDQALNLTEDSTAQAWRLLSDASLLANRLGDRNQQQQDGLASTLRSIEVIALRLGQQILDLRQQETSISDQTEEPQQDDPPKRARLDFEWESQWCLTQQNLSDSLVSLQEQTSRLPALNWMLQNCASSIDRSVALIKRDRITDTLRTCNEAQRQLQAAMSALAAAQSSGESDENTAEQASDPDSQQSEQSDEGGFSLIDLLLIRELQADLNEQSLQLEATRSEIPESQLRESERRIAQNQEELAELVGEILEGMGENQ